jgi:predicted enzyme related to lactoylglutathione lyase
MQVRSLRRIFTAARDHTLMTSWYRFHFGIELHPDGSLTFPLAVPNANGFLVCPAMTNDEGEGEVTPEAGPFAIMFFVDDLEGLLAHLDREGVQVESQVTRETDGLFGVVTDPEQNRIVLWQMP